MTTDMLLFRGAELACKEWPGAKSKGGYGQKSVDGKVQYLHRLEWAKHNGPIPPRMEICHSCDNPPCYEITHLWLGTHAENMADHAAKGRGTNQNTGKTHCIYGHLFDADNTYRTSAGARQCRACIAARPRRYSAQGAAS